MRPDPESEKLTVISQQLMTKFLDMLLLGACVTVHCSEISLVKQ